MTLDFQPAFLPSFPDLCFRPEGLHSACLLQFWHISRTMALVCGEGCLIDNSNIGVVDWLPV